MTYKEKKLLEKALAALDELGDLLDLRMDEPTKNYLVDTQVAVQYGGVKAALSALESVKPTTDPP